MAFVPGRGLGEIVAHLKDAQTALAKARGAGWTVDDVALEKLRWLERDGRDFRKITPKLKLGMERAFVKKLDDVLLGRASVDAPAKAAVQVFVDTLAERLETGGGDVAMRPLDPETAKRKGHDRIGDDSGDLKRRVKRAKVRTVR